MKKYWHYGIIVTVLCITFSAGYYVSYLNAYENYKQNDAGGGELSAEISADESSEDSAPDTLVDVVSMGNVVVKPSTKFILETVDVDNGTELREERNPTGDFVGLNRDEIIAFLASYMENMPLAEYEKGLSSYELVSFSSKEFCIRKTYDTSVNPNKFYVTLKNNYVIIYYSDKTSIYDYTSISGNALPYGDKLRLLEGFYVKDSDELYALLEGYTS